MENNGWVKVHRKILDNPISSNSYGFRVWMECLLRAAHEKTKIDYYGKEIELKPGEFVFGRVIWARKLGMTESTLYKWIQRLLQEKMLIKRVTGQVTGQVTGEGAGRGTGMSTIFQVQKWEQYQSKEQVSRQISNRSSNRLGNSLGNTNKKYKNINNKKNKKNSDNQKIWDSLSKQDKWLVEKGHLVIKNGKLLSVDLGDI